MTTIVFIVAATAGLAGLLLFIDGTLNGAE